jgi:hypothetical protein
MNDEDLRDCFAMFALMSYWKDGDVASDLKTAAAWSYDMADAMIEARNAEPEQEVGIVAAKPRRKKSA